MTDLFGNPIDEPAQPMPITQLINVGYSLPVKMQQERPLEVPVNKRPYTIYRESPTITWLIYEDNS